MGFSSDELLTLQKLVVDNSPDTLMFSEEELIKMAYYNSQGYLNIVYDSIRLVNNTANPDVFFSRYKLLEEKLCTLSLLEPYIKFKENQPSSELCEI